MSLTPDENFMVIDLAIPEKVGGFMILTDAIKLSNIAQTVNVKMNKADFWSNNHAFNLKYVINVKLN